jgi:thiol-disulfide isomerase/thioredoxin
MATTPPPPIDPRGPRFNQAVLTVALLAGVATGTRWVAPLFAAVLLLGAAFGPRYGPFLRLYAQVIKPRLAPPAELEDPRPPRFAAAVGVAFLLGATTAFAAGAAVVGWALVLVVAALAGLAAVTGICVGCEVYLFLRQAAYRLAGGRSGSPPARLVDLTAGAERTWVVFTTPFCATCEPVKARLAAADPSARLVAVDATEQPALADAFRIRTAPTALLTDADGNVLERLVGPSAVDAYVSARNAATAAPAYRS